MENPLLSVIIPAYNESARISTTLLDIDKTLSGVDFSYEILVVNDGSTDNTVQVVNNMKSAILNLRVLDFKENRGKGAVVRSGMLEAKGQYRLFTDADNSTSIDHFFKMQPYFGEGYDVIICSRAHKDSVLEPAQSVFRQVPGRVGNLIIQALLLPGLWDTQCGFKAFSEEASEKVFSLSRIDGWGFDVESLALAKHLGYRIKEIPVHWVNDARSHVKASAYLKVLLETLKIRIWLWMGKYSKKVKTNDN